MTKRLITQELSDTLLEQYPALRDNKGYRKLVLKLIFSRNDNNYTTVNRVTLASCEGCFKTFLNHRYNGSLFLSSFQKEVGLKLSIKEYNYKEGRARSAKPTFAPLVQQSIDKELESLFMDPINMIDFVTLKKANKNTAGEIRKELD